MAKKNFLNNLLLLLTALFLIIGCTGEKKAEEVNTKASIFDDIEIEEDATSISEVEFKGIISADIELVENHVELFKSLSEKALSGSLSNQDKQRLTSSQDNMDNIRNKYLEAGQGHAHTGGKNVELESAAEVYIDTAHSLVITYGSKWPIKKSKNTFHTNKGYEMLIQSNRKHLKALRKML